MSSTPVPDLSIITVSWNVRDLLRQCLASIEGSRADLALEVIVVDGASHDGSAEMVREAFPWARLIACTDNVGFPRGNNLGIAAAHGRHILLLNPDTVVLDGALTKMVAYMDKHSDVGALGPRLLNPDGSVQSSRRHFPTFSTAVFESTWLEPYAPQRILNHYYAQDLSVVGPVDVDWVTGAALLVPRRVINHVGLLDEGYFMYSEELDWCRRIKDAGWRVVYLPEAGITHHIGKSSEQAVTARHINFQQAKLRYFRKHHGRLPAAALRLLLLSGYVWQIALEGAKGLAGHKRPLRRQRIASYWQVLRSGLRPAGY